MSSKIGKALIGMSPAMFFATSLISKDVVGCVMYTSTARKNKQYTPEKRSDVANYDLANGLINIALQLLAIKPLEYALKRFSDSHFMKHFYQNLDERLKGSDKKIVMELLKNKELMVGGSVAFISAILLQYGIKRFISPFFSMPVGQKFASMGVIKPKLYPGETFEKAEKTDNTDKIEAASKMEKIA